MIRSNITWIDEHAPELKGKTLVTLSMEGCIPELKGDAREANIKGGLGIYFGDKLEGLNVIGMDGAFGCMPLYTKRLIQSIKDGAQHIEYKDVSYEGQPIEYVMDRAEKPMQFDVWGWNEQNVTEERQYHVEVYSIHRGGTPLYVFYCPEVFDILYADDNTHPGHGVKHRFLQETVFGECVHELFKSMRIVPDILHLNEGHVADGAAIVKGDRAFDKTAVAYTNHTVVPAGLEKFSIGELVGGDLARARYAMRFPGKSWQRFWRKFVVEQDNELFIDFSRGALEICDAANGVSNEHADVTQNLFPHYDRGIEAILNGSGDTWAMDELLEMELEGVEPSKETLLRISAEGKAASLAEVNKRTAGMTNKDGQLISRDGIALDSGLPTIWMVRRMVGYKSQLPILKDIIHIVCADRNDEVDTIWGRMNGLGMQVVVGGIAPDRSSEEGWIEEFVGWMQRPELKGRFVYVPNSDTILLGMQSIGADICINCPAPEKEACGTSDQRSSRNGGINIATRSGGPPEYIEDGRNGMLVGPYESNEDFYARAPKDILDKLRELSEMYYNDDSLWLDMKLESYLASPKVTAIAMEQRYAGMYVQALRAREDIIRSRDRGRNQSPDAGRKVLNSKVIYEMVVRDYYDAENHVLGLSVAAEELPFLAESGVEYIYLLGLMKHAGNPFDVMDPFDIDERAGSSLDLDNFVSVAHALGLKVITDWMANQHVSKNSPLCRAHPDWFLYTDAEDGDYFADNGTLLYRGRYVHADQKNLVLVSATDEVPIRGFSRRWSSLAQPDLSHPQLAKHAIETGRFWLAKGLDGFRIDAALSTFPDKIKENWGLDVTDNLTRLFIEDMRRIKPDCFIMFEGFERAEELMQLADCQNCAVYSWQPRNLATDAFEETGKLDMLISHLKELEHAQQIRDNLVNLGPEHDAFDFEDPWAQLSYRQRLFMHFMYVFMPGYTLAFNGQAFGRRHRYKADPAKTSPAPRVAEADNGSKQAGRRLFRLRRDYPQLVTGDYKVLVDDQQDVICLARFDENGIVIGVINPNAGAKEAQFSLGDIIGAQLNPSDIKHAHYMQDVVLLANDAKGWISETRDNIPAEKLLAEGLYVGIDPRSCQVIRLRPNVSI